MRINMAAQWSRNLRAVGKVALVVGGGAALTYAAYAGYLYFQRMKKENKDEGFEENLKVEDNPEKRILVLGLDGAGKSSFLSCLGKQENRSDPRPTEGFNVMCIQTDNVSLNVWEIGGTADVRRYWSNFVQDTDILVFVVDSADEKRLPEAFDELHKVLGDDRLKRVPIVILANKQDVAGAQKPDEIKQALGMDNMPSKEHVVYVIGTQAPTGGASQGVGEAEQLLISLTS